MIAAPLMACVKRFRSASSGIAAVEFSLILPVLIALFLGTLEIARYAAFQRNLAGFVEGVAADIASRDGPVDSLTLYQMLTTAGLIVPQLSYTPPVYSVRYKVNVSVVRMTPTIANCLSNCTYTADLAWTFGDLKRSCGVIAASPNQSDYDIARIPSGVFQSGSVVVVDVVAKYAPVFGSAVIGDIDYAYSAYAPARNYTAGAYLPWAGGNTWWTGVKCPGFP